MSKMKPRKHAEVIKAWADGAEIEWRPTSTGGWVTDTSNYPAFANEEFEFRVKEQKVVRWLWVVSTHTFDGRKQFFHTNRYFSEVEIKECFETSEIIGKLKLTRMEFNE